MAVLGRRHRHRQHRNPQGFRWLISVLAVLGLAFAGLVGGAGVAAASSDENHEEYWEGEGYGDCKKVVDKDMAAPYVLGSPLPGTVWTALILKAGSTGHSVTEENHLVTNPAPGPYSHPEKSTISHVIVCWKDAPPEEPAVTATALACSDSEEATGVVRVTLVNPNAEAVTYTVELAGQDAELEVAGEASGSVTFTGLAAGEHDYVVTGDDDTSVDGLVTVEECEPGQQEPQEPAVTVSAQACSETDEATGEVTVTVENPNAEAVTYTVELAGQEESVEVAGEATESVTFEGVAAGTHTVTVDGNDTSVEASVTVEECQPGQEEPQEPSVTATSQGCAAVGGANGVVTVTVENPNAEAVTYTVELAGQDAELEVAGEASRSVTFTGLAAGEHDYVVTGDDDTSVDGSVTVEECKPVDVCPNIVGNQAEVPSTMTKNTQGDCVAGTAVLGTKIPAQSGTQVLGTKVAAGTLARTGGEVSGLLGLSLVFMGAGAALLMGRRRSAKG